MIGWHAHRHAAVAVAFVSALLFGVWWIPVRAMDALGAGGLWGTALLVAGAIPPLAAALWLRPPRRGRLVPREWAAGALIGVALAFYTTAVGETTVVRAVLIFYLAPAWSMLIEALAFGRRFGLVNALAFACAAAGIALVFRLEISLSGWNRGDTMALLSGLTWAAGSALVFSGPETGARRLSLAACVTALLLTLALAVALGEPPPAAPALTTGLPLAMVCGLVYVAPMMAATLWAARRLAPTTLCFLLTGEIISGVASAAFLLDEPFGWMEVGGAALIIAAALSEVVASSAAAVRPPSAR